MIIDGQNVDDLSQSFGYNEDGTLAYVQVVTAAVPGAYAGGTYQRTFTYDTGRVTQVSGWVKVS